MNAKQLTARTAVLTLPAAFVVGASVGMHHDGGWGLVAVVWVTVVAVMAAGLAIAWGLDNWNDN